MTALQEKQCLFARLLGKFLVWIYEQPGLAVVGGEWQRSKAQAEANAASGAGISKSLHLKCLAVDLALFIDRVYQTESHAYAALGEKWKSLHPLCRWGGDFKSRPDGNHFSIEHEGVQ
jgi:hypothetical protein